MAYQLSVENIETICLFKLTWGQSQQISVRMPYLPQLETFYQRWQRAYLAFYKQALRGRAGATGQVNVVNPDLHSPLVQAEAQLLSEFHRWLRRGELIDIRKTLTLAAQQQPIDLFLNCEPVAIARLPWETWEIGAEFGGAKIRMARSPSNIRAAPVVSRLQRRKPRVLVIFGDDTGLDFAADRQAISALNAHIDLTTIGWQPHTDTAALKQDICSAIADAQGWDVLLFIGHSNEVEIVSGHIYIAPNTALSVRELTSYLQAAQANGLQFAMFNSCSGLNIADALIELGLNQVAIMREPIHNQVAQRFLVQFLQALVAHHDVQDALQIACDHLKLEQHLTYPSAHLVPSLFRHPNSHPFQIPPSGWQQTLGQWLPTWQQGVALAGVVALSLVPSVEATLLSGRLLMQAIYRDLTGQTSAGSAPPVVLVQVDEASQREAPELSDISPIDQSYLARLLDELIQNQAQVIGIDYLLDFPQPDRAPILAASVRRAVVENNAWLVFSAEFDDGELVGVNPKMNIVDFAWALQGYTNVPAWFMAIPWQAGICYEAECPFPHMLALSAQYSATDSALTPSLERTEPLRPDLMEAIAASNAPKLDELSQRHLSLATVFFSLFGQQWLRPVLDFSLPPDQVFYRISAYEVLANPVEAEVTAAIANAEVVLIGGVGYAEGGVDPLLTDIYPNPPGIAYWRRRGQDSSRGNTFAGVEAIAYDVHHQVLGHWVTPIPSLWMVSIALVLGPAIALYGIPKLSRRRAAIWLAVGTVGYGIIGLQVAVSGGVILPWLLPGATVWIYAAPKIRALSDKKLIRWGAAKI